MEEERIAVTEQNIHRLNQMFIQGLIKQVGTRPGGTLGTLYMNVDRALVESFRLSIGNWIVYSDNLSPLNLENQMRGEYDGDEVGVHGPSNWFRA